MKISTRIRWILPAILSAVLATGCAGFGSKGMSDEDTARQAIAAATAANKQAAAAGYEWRDTADLIKKANAAFEKGDYAEAIKLANKAKKQAELAVMQGEAERKRLGGTSAGSGMQADSYTVMRGDSLWAISGKPEIYNNAYQWPLIYKANSSRIKDADVIFPGQNLVIGRDWSASDISAAVQHAKTRGAWTVGVMEDADAAYLSR